MNLRFSLALFCIIVLAACQSEKTSAPSFTDEDRAKNLLLPIPSTIQFGKKTLDLSEGLKTAQSALVPGFLFDDLLGTDGSIPLQLSCTNTTPNLSTPLNSEYWLNINEKGVAIKAGDYGSFIHALQSLRQILRQYPITAVPYLTIHDRSRYAWRGLMIDVSRRWIPIQKIKEQVDIMSSYKMNVLHLHLSDNQSFRIESKTFPRLHELASRGEYYTQDDIRHLIQYAGERGVVIVPEFNMPGHATSWLLAYPGLGAKDTVYTLRDSYGVFAEALNPLNDKVYEFLTSFFTEMASLFPSTHMHVGGNEVLPDDWISSESMKATMQRLKLTTVQELQLVFNYKLERILSSLGKTMIAWDEALHPQLVDKGILIQSWRGSDVTIQSARMGVPTLHSAGWYLDQKLTIGELYMSEPTIDINAINIDIDSDQWSSYALQVDFRGQFIPAQLFVFGAKNALRGIMMMADKISAFEKASIKDNILSFTVQNNFGLMTASMDLGNSEAITGQLQMANFSLGVKGKKVGGHDMNEGIKLPIFKTAIELSPEQLQNIQGGEACLWTELTNEQTLNSRIWPAALAVAEKLWSPKSHTSDSSNDIYRRIINENDHLRTLAANPGSFQQSWIEDFQLPAPETALLQTYIALLEPSKHYERLTTQMDITIHTPLNSLSDAALPESFESYRFGQLVKLYNQGEISTELYLQMSLTLETWSKLYGQLKELVIETPSLNKSEIQLIALSDLSKMAIVVMNKGSLDAKELAYYERLKSAVSKPINSVVLAPVPHLIALIEIHLAQL